MLETVFVVFCLVCLLAGTSKSQQFSAVFNEGLLYATLVVLAICVWGIASWKMNFVLRGLWGLTKAFGVDRDYVVLIPIIPVGLLNFARAVIPRPGSFNTRWP